MTAADDYMQEMLNRAAQQSAQAHTANGYAGWAHAAGQDPTVVPLPPGKLWPDQTLHQRMPGYAPLYEEKPVSHAANQFVLARHALRMYEKGDGYAPVTLAPALIQLLKRWMLPTTHDGLYAWWREHVIEVSL